MRLLRLFAIGLTACSTTNIIEAFDDGGANEAETRIADPVDASTSDEPPNRSVEAGVDSESVDAQDASAVDARGSDSPIEASSTDAGLDADASDANVYDGPDAWASVRCLLAFDDASVVGCTDWDHASPTGGSPGLMYWDAGSCDRSNARTGAPDCSGIGCVVVISDGGMFPGRCL